MLYLQHHPFAGIRCKTQTSTTTESEDNMQLKDNTKKTEERKNRFNGQSIMLTAEEARRHDNIFINELAATLEDREAGMDGHSEKWKNVRKDLDWFRQHNAEAYMVLLD